MSEEYDMIEEYNRAVEGQYNDYMVYEEFRKMNIKNFEDILNILTMQGFMKSSDFKKSIQKIIKSHKKFDLHKFMCFVCHRYDLVYAFSHDKNILTEHPFFKGTGYGRQVVIRKDLYRKHRYKIHMVAMVYSRETLNPFQVFEELSS